MTDSDSFGSILVDDVLLRIFSFSDIRSVLLASQVRMTNRHIYNLVFSKQVWLALLSDLHARNFVDLFPGQRLHDISTEGLVDLAKRVVLGPRSWLALHYSGPTLARKIVLNVNISADPDAHSWVTAVKMLSGGQFCLLSRAGTLECWDLVESKVIWVYQGNSSKPFWITQFAAEVVEQGRSVLIVLGVRVRGDIRQNFVEIISLNLRGGNFNTLALHQAPSSTIDNAFSRVKICSDVAMIGLDYPQGTLLLRISTGTCTVLNMSQGYSVDLIPGHLIVMQMGISPTTYDIKFWSIQTLLDSQSDGVTSIDAISPTAVLSLTDLSASRFRLSAHRYPLREDSSILWVHMAPITDGPYAVRKYSFSHSESGQLSICSISESFTETALSIPDVDGVSFAGYARLHSFEEHKDKIVCLSEGAERHVVDLPDPLQHVYFSPYSCAIAYPTLENIVVDYYL